MTQALSSFISNEASECHFFFFKSLEGSFTAKSYVLITEKLTSLEEQNK